MNLPHYAPARRGFLMHRVAWAAAMLAITLERENRRG